MENAAIFMQYRIQLNIFMFIVRSRVFLAQEINICIKLYRDFREACHNVLVHKNNPDVC